MNRITTQEALDKILGPKPPDGPRPRRNLVIALALTTLAMTILVRFASIPLPIAWRLFVMIGVQYAALALIQPYLPGARARCSECGQQLPPQPRTARTAPPTV